MILNSINAGLLILRCKMIVLQVTSKWRMLTQLTIIIVTLIWINKTPVYAMETSKVIGDEINNGNLNIAENLLEMLRNQQINRAHLNRVDEAINTRMLELKPNATYHVQNGEIHHTENIPETYPILTWRDIALALSIAVVFPISIYVIYKYWNEIRESIFGVVTNIIPSINPVQLAMANRLERINDPELYRRIYLILTERV